MDLTMRITGLVIDLFCFSNSSFKSDLDNSTQKNITQKITQKKVVPCSCNHLLGILLILVK